MEVIEKEIGNVLICSIKGQILLCTEEECRKYFEKLSEEKSRTSVIINMSGVGYVNNAGVGMIVESFRKFRENGGRLVLCSLTPEVAKLFEIIRLTELIEIYPYEESAIMSIQAK